MNIRLPSLAAALLLGGCIGINPSWDQSEEDGGLQTSTSDGSAWGTGDGTSSSPVSEGTTGTSDGEPGTGSSDEEGMTGGTWDQTPGMPGTTGTSGDTTGSGEATCIEQGLYTCEGEFGSYCADLSRDPLNCGSCSRRCGDEIEGSTCESGACVCSGGGPWRVCGDRCTNTNNDPRACGAGCVDCVAAMGPEAGCQGGSCRP